MGVTELVTVTISGGDANGTIIGSGISATSTPGTYVVGAAGISPSDASAILRRTIFKPAERMAAKRIILTITVVQTSPTSPMTVSSRAVTIVTITTAACGTESVADGKRE
jgi:hypothetical protein